MTNTQPAEGLTRDAHGRHEYTDLDGDTIRVTPINSVMVGRLGPSVYLQTTEPGVYIPVADVEAFVDAVRRVAALVADRAATSTAQEG
jgi:hypothetical protein